MKSEVEVRDRYDKMNSVVSMYLKGDTEAAIVRKTGIKGTEVANYIAEYKGIAANDDYIKSRARESVVDADNAMKMIIANLWQVVEDAGSDIRSKTTALKNLADIEAKRTELLQKVSANGDAAMAAEMAKTEEKMKIIQEILSDVSRSCPNCKLEIARRLTKVTGKPIPVDVDSV